MPRDSSGTYTPSPSSPFVTGTPIASSTANTRAADVATELTNSLDRQGRGGMLAALAFSGIAATIRSGIANGASAVGHVLDTVSALSTSGAKLLSLRNAGVEKAYIDKDGHFIGAGVSRNTADQVLTTSFAAVSGLSFAVEANGNYAFEALIPCSTSATTAGFQTNVTGPAGATIEGTLYWVDNGSGVKAFPLFIGASDNTTSPNFAHAVHLVGVVRAGSTAGSVAVQARSSSGTATARNGAWIRAARLP